MLKRYNGIFIQYHVMLKVPKHYIMKIKIAVQCEDATV